jgi:ABC-type branched-subunit amino acid transport system ATPase component
VNEAGATSAAGLVVEDLVVSFGGLRAVDHVSLTVDPRSVTALIGANGSGKTTLLDAVSGLVASESGRVLLDGEDISELLPEERAGLGVVRSFQDCRLFPELTVEDTLLLVQDGRRLSDVMSTTLQLPWARRSERAKAKAVDQVLSSFRLDRFRHRTIAQLSTGTRRVVDLAAVVLAHPRLLLLDEPTAGIAQREVEAFVPLLRQIQEVTDCSVLLVEHDVPLAFELCTSVVVMQAGRVVASGPPELVRRDPAALDAYLGASEEAMAASGPMPASVPITGGDEPARTDGRLEA